MEYDTLEKFVFYFSFIKCIPPNSPFKNKAELLISVGDDKFFLYWISLLENLSLIEVVSLTSFSENESYSLIFFPSMSYFSGNKKSLLILFFSYFFGK